MFYRVWQNIKNFYFNHAQHAWLEHLLLYLFIAGVILFLVIIFVKMYKEDKRLNQEKRRLEKKILRLLGKQKNKDRNR